MKRWGLALAAFAVVLMALSLPAGSWADESPAEPEPPLDPDWSASFVPPAMTTRDKDGGTTRARSAEAPSLRTQAEFEARSLHDPFLNISEFQLAKDR